MSLNSIRKEKLVTLGVDQLADALLRGLAVSFVGIWRCASGWINKVRLLNTEYKSKTVLKLESFNRRLALTRPPLVSAFVG